MSLFINPFTPVFNAGVLVPGALYHFYIAGTSTPADGQSGNPGVYTSSSLSTEHDWPVEADANGILPAIYLDPAYTYKVVITDEEGDLNAPLKTYDPYDPNAVANQPIETISSATHTMAATDKGAFLNRTYAGNMADTLPAPASVGNGFWVTVRNDPSISPATKVIDATVYGGGNINGASSLDIPIGGVATFICDGTSYLATLTADSFPLTQGLRSVHFDAAALKETTTNGCSILTQGETTTNKVNYLYRDFTNASTKYAFGNLYLPSSYLGETLYFNVLWTSAAGSLGETVRFALQARCFQDDSALDAAWATAVTVDDALLATGDVHVSGWTAFDPANATNDAKMYFRIARDHTAGTLAQTVRILGVTFRIPLERGNDA